MYLLSGIHKNLGRFIIIFVIYKLNRVPFIDDRGDFVRQKLADFGKLPQVSAKNNNVSTPRVFALSVSEKKEVRYRGREAKRETLLEEIQNQILDHLRLQVG